MPDPVTEKLSDVESKLRVLADPNKDDPANGKAHPTLTLQAIGEIFRQLRGIDGVGDAVGVVSEEIETGLKDAAEALKRVARELSEVVNKTKIVTDASGQPINVSPADILNALRNALAMAQTMLPGSPAALNSASDFFGMLADLLRETGGDVKKATTVLFLLAQEIQAVGTELNRRS